MLCGIISIAKGVLLLQALYLTNHPIILSKPFAIGVLLVGLVMIYINWEADDQRQRVRESDGRCKVWGKEPTCIVAHYTSGAPTTDN